MDISSTERWQLFDTNLTFLIDDWFSLEPELSYITNTLNFNGHICLSNYSCVLNILKVTIRHLRKCLFSQFTGLNITDRILMHDLRKHDSVDL